MRKYSRSRSYSSRRNYSCYQPKNSCVVEGKVNAEIALTGDGVRGMLAEMFLVGGSVDLGLGIDIACECGDTETVTLTAIGEAAAVAKH